MSSFENKPKIWPKIVENPPKDRGVLKSQEEIRREGRDRMHKAVIKDQQEPKVERKDQNDVVMDEIKKAIDAINLLLDELKKKDIYKTKDEDWFWDDLLKQRDRLGDVVRTLSRISSQVPNKQSK